MAWRSPALHPVKSLRRLQSGLFWALSAEIGYPRWAVSTKGGSVSPRALIQGREVRRFEYSRESLSTYHPLERTKWLYSMLGAIPNLPRNRLLVLGPRYEAEYYLARSMGWNKRDIHLVDNFSYSSKIALGDMHKLEFESDSFGAVVCGWTLSYSVDPWLAGKEITRVLEVDGILILGAHLTTPSELPIGTVEDIDSVFPELIRVATFETKSPEHLVVCYKKSNGSLKSK